MNSVNCHVSFELIWDRMQSMGVTATFLGMVNLYTESTGLSDDSWRTERALLYGVQEISYYSFFRFARYVGANENATVSTSSI